MYIVLCDQSFATVIKIYVETMSHNKISIVTRCLIFVLNAWSITFLKKKKGGKQYQVQTKTVNM